MSKNEILIKKNQYLSYSKNIIECFSIIGYEEKLLPDIIHEYKITKVQNYSPTIISTIISDKDFGIIDNDFIISQIFPDNPEFILNTKTNNSLQEEPSFKNIIYSSMTDSPDSPEGEKKIFYTCFSFVFHEIYTFENNDSSKEEYFIPKAFCIISQYPFFGFFKYICLNLYRLFLKNSANKKHVLPIENIIYNIVNFIPSPLNHNINYFLFKDILDIPSYNFPQLSGYPILDFNIFEVFNILPVRLFVEIYLYTILEQSILFFSSNLEILNMVMYIFYSFNYPCNNSTYFWHIVSISKKELKEENRFVGQIMTSMLGVHCQYNENIDTSAFGASHFIVDIDNKKLILKNYNNNDGNKKIFGLYSYIHNIIDEKDVESLFIKKYIDRLIKKVQNLLKENEIEISKNKIINFFGKINRKMNKNIQEYFYNFIINLLLVIYQNINIELSVGYLNTKFNKTLYFKKENENLLIKDEELLFCNFFISSSKYKLYFEIFLENNESSELFKVPLLFSEEFVNLKLKSNQNKIALKLPYFLLMDDLYIPSSKEFMDINLCNFSFKYTDNELNIEFIKEDKQAKNIKKVNKKNLITLNKIFLEKYIFILKNNFNQEKLLEYFPSIKIKEEKIGSMNSKEIVEKIQNFFEKNNYISSLSYLIYSSIYVFLILIPSLSYEKILFHIDKLLACCKKVNFFLRYYINIMIQTFYKYYLINNERKKFPNMTFDNMKLYIYLLFNALKEEKILPNEDMILIHRKFEEKNKTKDDNSQVKKINKDKDLIENIKKTEMDISNFNFSIYMKYNFDSTRFFQESEIIKIAMKEFKDCNIKAINSDLNSKSVIVVINVKEKQYIGELFSPRKVFETIKKEFKNYEKSFSFDETKISIITEILINLIQYSNELKDLKNLSELFISGLLSLDNFNKKK